MAERIITVRQSLKDNLESLGSPHKWDHITEQIGMFCFSGMTPEQVRQFCCCMGYAIRGGLLFSFPDFDVQSVSGKPVCFVSSEHHSWTGTAFRLSSCFSGIVHQSEVDTL